MITITPITRPTNMPLSVLKVPSRRRDDVLGRQCTPERERRDHDAEPADQHVDATDDVVEGGVAA